MKVPALLIALVICLGVLNAVNLTPLLGPLLYTMTPLQRYYATNYLASSWHKNDPAATTETPALEDEKGEVRVRNRTGCGRKTGRTSDWNVLS